MDNRKKLLLAVIVSLCLLFMAATTAINLATQVTGTLGITNGGTGVTSAQGNGTKVQLSTGTTTNGNVVKYDANGNTVDSGIACCAAAINFSENELPTGTINGVNTSFTLAHTPLASSLKLYKNGIHLQSGAGNDYTLSGATVTMLSAPATGDILLADYRY